MFYIKMSKHAKKYTTTLQGRLGIQYFSIFKFLLSLYCSYPYIAISYIVHSLVYCIALYCGQLAVRSVFSVVLYCVLLVAGVWRVPHPFLWTGGQCETYLGVRKGILSRLSLHPTVIVPDQCGSNSTEIGLAFIPTFRAISGRLYVQQPPRPAEQQYCHTWQKPSDLNTFE